MLEASTADVREIWNWNSGSLNSVDTCVHDLIAEQARKRPDSEAICSWEGSITYAELEQLSSNLAYFLAESLKVVDATDEDNKPFVPVVSEKSIWSVVAYLAILKAGCAFVPFDIAHPSGKLQGMVEEVGAKMLLVSPRQEERCQDMVGHVFVVTKENITKLAAYGGSPVDIVGLTTPAYVLFTSGTTGTPKGVVIEHASLSTHALHVGKALKFGKGSRMLQFSSYAFDVCIMEIITTLVHGGCVCVPSEWERMNNIGQSITNLGANSAFFTPSLLDNISYHDVKGLELIITGGEVIPLHVVEKWRSRVHLIICYGPAECSVVSAVLDTMESTKIESGMLGRPVGGRAWVVDENNVNILRPVGAVGELLIEGPILARGYLNDGKMTADSFIESPTWMPHRARFYKTGDLVRYNSDGILMFMDRKDTQVKLRGQRLELGEIENQLKRALMPLQTHVAAEMIALSGEPSETRSDSKALAAFVSLGNTPSAEPESSLLSRPSPVPSSNIPLPLAKNRSSSISVHKKNGSGNAIRDIARGSTDSQLLSSFLATGEECRFLEQALSNIEEKLSQNLPEYMLPSVYIPMVQMPLSVSGKLDRLKLCQIASAFSLRRSASTSSVEKPCSTLTGAAKVLQRLWAKEIRTSIRDIDLDTNFFRIGGDSLVAMRLVAAARAAGLSITVDQIFRNPQLRELSEVAAVREAGDGENPTTIRPFSLIDVSIIAQALGDAVDQCGVATDTIEDIYPCTPSQEGMMTAHIQNPATYVMRLSCWLPSTVSIDSFKNAWQTVAEHCSILRTRLFQTCKLGMMQVILKEQLQWHVNEDVRINPGEDYTSVNMGLGKPLARYGLSRDQLSGLVQFIWEVHHCILDGTSLLQILLNVDRVYAGKFPCPSLSLNHFVQYLANSDDKVCEEFWQEQLLDAPPPSFPVLPSSTTTIRAGDSMEKDILLSRKPGSEITTATIARAAWALLSAKYSTFTPDLQKFDVVFGTTLSGRTVQLTSIENVLGPTITTIPLRICFDNSQFVTDYLRSIQDQSIATIPFEHFGMTRIMRLGAEARAACAFQNLLVIQPSEFLKDVENESSLFRTKTWMPERLDFALMIECVLVPHGLKVCARYDSAIIQAAQIGRILRQFEYILQQLASEPEMTCVRDVKIASPTDLREILCWNEKLPKTYNQCVQKMVYSQVQKHPEMPAIHAWDGQLSYRQLQTVSNQLARRLRHFGVDREVSVSLCFEKSAWAVVSELAVLVAGGVCVPLDPSHPKRRLQAILTATATHIILCSPKHASLFDGCSQQVLIVDASLWQSTVEDDRSSFTRNTQTPEDPAYVIFTSGSTGTPKGIVIDHRALCTSIYYHAQVLRLGSRSRVLQFAAFTFDISLSDIFATLSSGGCVCVPSDYDRLNNLEAAIESLRANQVCLTTSVARQLRPERLESLEILALCGEAPTREILALWAEKVCLINMYGPSECSIYSAGRQSVRKDDCPENIGFGVGALLWIVDPYDHNVLCPLGGVGELLIEGPILGRGYLNDSARTEAAFITNPTWMLDQEPCSPRERRLYKTGDLARYDIDGSIVYMGRKDKQVKIRGQRVELGEVEYHLRHCIDSPHEVVVEALRPANSDSQCLVAFICIDDDNSTAQDTEVLATCLSAKEHLKELVDGLDRRLASRVPKYMIPSAYIPLNRMPKTTSAKTDRDVLRNLISKFSARELAAFSLNRMEIRAPSTISEEVMRKLWAQVLDIKEDSIAIDDNFFQLGGDSITAIGLVATARDDHVSLSADQVFKHPQLSEMAALTQPLGKNCEVNIAPFVLIPDTSSVDCLRSEVAAQCKVSPESIVDIYPCTPCQEFFIDFSMHYPDKGTLPNGYSGYLTYIVPPMIDLDKFRSAWETIVATHAILRTRIIRRSNNYFQVVLNSPLVWDSSDDLESYVARRKGAPMGFGDSLFRCCLIHEKISDKSRYFVLTIHHVLYDYWSLSLLMRAFDQVYKNGPTQAPEVKFNAFIKHLQDADAESSDRFWHEQLADSKTAPFCQVSDAVIPSLNATESLEIVVREQTASEITLATTIHAAWCFLIAQYTAADDVVLDIARAGRASPVTGIGHMIAPTVTHVPLRVQIDYTETTQKFLKRVQERLADGLKFETRGWKNIRLISDETRSACEAATLLVINSPPPGHTRFAPLEFKIVSTGTFTDPPVPIMLTCMPSEGLIDTQVRFDTRFFKVEGVKMLLNQFASILQEMVKADAQHILSQIKVKDATASHLYCDQKAEEMCEDGAI